MEKEIIRVFKYFAYFQYPPTFDDVYIFLKKREAKKRVLAALKEMERKKKIIHKENRYTLGGYSIFFKIYPHRKQLSKEKLQKAQKFIQTLQKFPQIKLIGISGSVAMDNAEKKDDIDLFIISAKNRIWTARIIALLLAQVMGVRRKRGLKEAQDKICLNLFFDAYNPQIPEVKQTAYVGHEILQMKPVVNKDRMYEQLLAVNRWVFKLFPNAERYYNIQHQMTHNSHKKQFFLVRLSGNLVERFVRRVQLSIINKHKTKEIITSTQLWFFPRDFEKKLKIKW